VSESVSSIQRHETKHPVNTAARPLPGAGTEQPTIGLPLGNEEFLNAFARFDRPVNHGRLGVMADQSLYIPMASSIKNILNVVVVMIVAVWVLQAMGLWGNLSSFRLHMG
jgi:hypothetical protein